MKTFLCLFMLSAIYSKCFAVDYYSQGAVSPNVLTNWDINPGGGGGAPTSFTNPGDKFIIQAGHIMTTTATWTFGGAGSILQIQDGGVLKGDHLIIITGIFQIDNGGTYIHSNTGSVAETASSSIFSGTESFAADSHFEIRNWTGKNVGLPNAGSGISWGDLIINLQTDISSDGDPWNWNISDGETLTIKGDLDIRATFVAIPSELRFTCSGIQTINVNGNFSMSGSRTKVSIKSSPAQLVDGYTTMQVNGDIYLTGISQLELGVNTTFPNPYRLYELRFKGNFFSNSAAGILYSSSRSAYLVANGIVPQSFFHLWNLGSNLRIASGATINLTSALTLYDNNQMLIVLGTLNQNGYKTTVNGKIECAGGIFNSSGDLYIGDSCTACSNLNGTYNNANNTWCTASGVKGRINFTNSSVSIDNGISVNLLTAGSSLISSPGDIYFINSTATSLSEIPLSSIFSVYENSIFSLDATSYINGDWATYQGRGGTLRIGSADGITVTGDITKGNIRTGLSKDYNFSGVNNFEYFGAGPQATGNGLPSTIDGTFKINNSAGMGTTGVILSQPAVVKGSLELISGKLTTSISALVTIDKNATVNLPLWGASYVAGPMKKTGNTSFKFPIGKGNNYAPLTLSDGGLVTDEYIAEYFPADPGQTIGSSFDNPPVNYLSDLEWWAVSRVAGTTAKFVTLEATAYSDAILLSDLRIMRWDSLAWRNEGNTGYSGISAGQVTSDVVSDFFTASTPTPFTFGSISFPTDPLAINLLSFDATRLTTTKSFLKWELANNSSAAPRFEIEKAGNSRNFMRIAVINGSPANRSYNYTDNDLKSGINYYRIKVIDGNGKITYSRIAAVMNKATGLVLTSLAPNLVTNTAMLTITSANQQKLELIVADMQGRILQKQTHLITAGNTVFQLSTDQLAAGAYQLFGITGEGKTNIIRFIKQ